MTREQLTDLERTAVCEALIGAIMRYALHDPAAESWRSALKKLTGADTEVIVMRAYPSNHGDGQ